MNQPTFERVRQVALDLLRQSHADTLGVIDDTAFEGQALAEGAVLGAAAVLYAIHSQMEADGQTGAPYNELGCLIAQLQGK